MLKKIAYLFIAALVSTPSIAQHNKKLIKPDRNKVEWTAEPNSIFGIKLGLHILDSGLVNCHPDAYKLKPTELCYETNQFSKTYLTVRGLPELSFPYSTSIILVDSAIESVIISLKHENFDKFSATLKEKYGPIHNTELSTVTAKSGGKFTRATHEWIGKSTSIRAIERAGSIDESYIIFTNNELQKIKTEQLKEIQKRDANKL